MDLRNQQFGESVTEAELTGSYLPAGAQQLVNQLQSLKGQAEVKGLPNTEVKALSAQADQLRAQLQSMGVDVSKIGAETSLANSTVGQRTMQGQQLDHNRTTDQRNFDYGVERDTRGDFVTDRNFNFQQVQQEWDNNFKQGQFDWNKAQQTWENAFQDKNFQQSMKEAAASRGLQWANLSQRQQEFVADQAFREKQFSYQQEQDSISNDLAYQKASGTSSAPTAEDYSKYIESSLHFGKDFTGNMTMTDRDAVESMILQSGLPSNEMKKLYVRYKIPMK